MHLQKKSKKTDIFVESLGIQPEFCSAKFIQQNEKDETIK